MQRADAYQAMPIALHGDGLIVHLECLDPSLREAALQAVESSGFDSEFYFYLSQNHGLEVLSRQNIGEMEEAHLGELTYEEAPQRADLLGQIDLLNRAIALIDNHVEPRAPSWAAGLVWQSGLDPASAVAELEEIVTAFRFELEELEDNLIAIDCDTCGVRIE